MNSEMPLTPGPPPGDLREHQVDDVLGHLVVAAGDPHLGAGDGVAAVLARLGLRADVGERGAGVGLREAHGAGEPALDHRLEEQPLLLVGAEGADHVAVAQGEARVDGGGDVRGLHPRERGLADQRGQADAALLGGEFAEGQARGRDRVEPGLGRGERLRGAVGLDRRLVRVGVLVVVRQLLHRDVGRQVERGVEGLLRVVREDVALGELLRVQPLVEQEVDVTGIEQRGLRCDVLLHGSPIRADTAERSYSAVTLPEIPSTMNICDVRQPAVSGRATPRTAASRSTRAGPGRSSCRAGACPSAAAR